MIITVHFAIECRSLPAMVIIIGRLCNMVDFYRATVSGGSICIIVPNFVKIGNSIDLLPWLSGLAI